MPQIRELNLLPPSRRQDLARQLVVVALTAFMRNVVWCLAVVSLVGVTAAVLLQVFAAFLSSSTTVLLTQQVSKYQELRTQIARENQNLNFMASMSTDRIVWSDLFADLNGAMPPGSHVQEIGGDLQPAPKLIFSGQAVSRSALVVLEDRLKQLPWVTSVEAPNSNLLQRINPTFTFDVFVKLPSVTPSPTP